MDQFVLLHFAIQKNERVYQFQVQPNSPWEEVYEALDEFKTKFTALEADTKKQAEEREALAQKPVESSSEEVVPEVVS